MKSVIPQEEEELSDREEEPERRSPSKSSLKQAS